MLSNFVGYRRRIQRVYVVGSSRDVFAGGRVVRVLDLTAVSARQPSAPSRLPLLSISTFTSRSLLQQPRGVENPKL